MKEIFTALSKAQGEFTNIELNSSVTVKTNSGSSYKFEYATLGQIMNAIRPILAKYELGISQSIEGGDMVTWITHSSGELITNKVPLSPYEIRERHKTTGEITVRPMTSQERGSVVSYFRRYSLVTALGLVAEDDEDANIAEGNEVKKETIKSIEEEKILSDGVKIKAFISPKTGKQCFAWSKGEEKGYLSGYEYDVSLSSNKLLKKQ